MQTGLTAKYKWGSSDERIAKGMSGGSYWRLAFPDRPKPNDVAKIELEFEFELTNEDKATIAKTTEVVIGEAIRVVKAALPKSNPTTLAEHVAAGSAPLVAAAKPLATFRAPDGRRGDEVVLEELGFKKRSDGSFELSNTKVLAGFSTIQVSANEAVTEEDLKTAAADFAAASKPSSATPYSTAVDAMTSDSKKAKDARVACAVATSKRADARVTALDVPGVPAAQKPAIDAAKKTSASARLIADDVSGNETPTRAFYAAINVLDGKEINGSYEWLAFKYADAQAAHVAAKETSSLARDELTKDLGLRIQILQRDEIGSVFLEGAGEKRWYDVSTGVVYVGGLEDVVIGEPLPPAPRSS